MTPPKKQPAPTTKVCGFHGPGGVVTETALRAAIAAAATTERGTWRPGGTFQKEDDPARFGDLVRYWLGGTKGHEVIRPDTLLAAQQAALDPSVKYGVLPTSTLSTAVSAFVAADQAVDTTAAALLGRWDDVDAAQVAFDAARAKVAPAEAAVDGAVTVKNDAEKAVTQAEAGVKAGTTSQAVLNQAKIDLGAATTTLVEAKAALTAAVAVRDTKKTALRTAEKNRNDAKKAFVKAKKDKDKVEAPAAALNTTLLKKVVDQLLAVPRPAGVPAIKRSFVNAAVEQAHQSRWEIAAWSAAFVTACVRGVAIAQKLEAMDGGVHRGPNVLLVATGRHTEYVIAARDQKKAGTYHAFEPETRPVQAGDIIVTDRVTEIEDRIGLKALAGSRELHGDIVIDVKTVDGTRVAETIGGNVHDTVRRRRYLLDGSDMLVVERERLFAEEKDNGAFDLFVTRPTRPTILPSSSTRRIFALLSLVQECKDVPASQELESPWGSIDRLLTDIAVVDRPSPWRVPTGNQRLMAKASEQLESPFLDEEIVAGERWGPTDASESWAEEVDASGAGEVSSGTAEAEADWEGTQNLEDVTDSGETWDPETPASWNREGEPDLEEEWKDLAPADVPDEAVAQPPYAPAIRARLEPLLDTKRAAAAATWNAARHPAKSGVDTATLLARLDRYVDRAAVERAMQASADLQGLTSDPHAVLAVVAHQFQQKIQIPPPPPTKKHPKPPDGVVDGKVGEGTLDALGFVRHRDASLNRVDALNVDFHVKGNTKAYRRVKEAYAAAASEFTALGPDVTAKNWYYLFVNPPFLGRPFLRGVHLELMRRLRLAERWLLSLPKYQGMSPVELGAALGIDEDHHGGRTTTNNSMHTLGLAVDIGYIKNPWVAGQHGNDGMPNKGRNDAFQTVTGNVARLLTGVDEAMTPLWLAGLGADPKRTTDSAFTEVQQRHARLLEYLALENDPDRLRAIIQQQTQGSNPQLVIKRGETVDASVVRWRKHIKDDRTIHLPHALGSSRKPGAGFMNLHRDLVVAMRDHGCLAWGAVDLGRNACGDMMHFDCRASGLGWTLSLQKQRTAGANHPCGTAATSPATTQSEMSVMSTSTAAAAVGAVGPLGAVGAVGELGTTGTAARTTSSSAPTPAHFLDGLLWTFPAKTLPVPIGVFCPKAVQQPNAVELLVYAHGLLSPCPPRPKKMPRDLITSPPFHLAKLVDASGRATVLVVPFLDWDALQERKLSFGRRNRQHKLARPADFNAAMNEVLEQIGQAFGTSTPSLSNLVVAGHSRAFDFLDPLAAAHADLEMSRGALGKLAQVWAFDSAYTAPVDDYAAWLAAKPVLEIDVFFRPGSSTDAGGKKFEGVAAKSGGRLRVTRAAEGHCAVPGRRFPDLLKRPTVSATPEIGYERDADETFTGDEGQLYTLEAAVDDEELEGKDFDTEDFDTADLEGEDDDLAREDPFGEAVAEWEAEAEPEEWVLGGWRQPAPAVKAPVCKDDRCASGYIRWMQESLNKVLGTTLDVSGKLDGATQRAIKKFKKRRRVKTKQVYAGAAIEQALVAAGAAAPPALTKVPCGVSSAAELVPLLEKHRGDIPLNLLMGWIQVESGRDLGSLTSICERGYFQLHPDESIMLGLDHDLVGTNAEYSVQAGIALVKMYRKTVDALSAKYGITKGDDVYWRLVKLCHFIPSAPKKILALMDEAGAKDRSWEGIRTFVTEHKETLQASIKRDPLDGLRGVDHMFEQADSWAAKLKTR